MNNIYVVAGQKGYTQYYRLDDDFVLNIYDTKGVRVMCTYSIGRSTNVNPDWKSIFSYDNHELEVAVIDLYRLIDMVRYDI